MKTFYFHFPLSCNYSCIWCCTSSVRKRTFFNVDGPVGYLKRFFENGFGEVRFSGGEPLIYGEEFRYLIRNTIKPGISYTVNSNGSLIKEYLDLFINKKPRLMWISVNTFDNELHKFITATDTSCHDIVKCIIELLKYKIKIGLNILVSKLNIDEIPFLLRVFTRIGVREFKLLDLTHLGRGSECFSINATPSKMRVLFNDIRKSFTYPVRIRADVARINKYDVPICYLAERSFLTLLYNGKVFPCYAMAFNGSEEFISYDMASDTGMDLTKLLLNDKYKSSDHPPCLYAADINKRCPIYLTRLV